MKTYSKPEIMVESLFPASAIAGDPFDLSNNYLGGNEIEVPAEKWWDLLG